MKKMVILIAALATLVIVSIVIVGVVAPGLIAPKNQSWGTPIALTVVALSILWLLKIVIMRSNPLKCPIAGLRWLSSITTTLNGHHQGE